MGGLLIDGEKKKEASVRPKRVRSRSGETKSTAPVAANSDADSFDAVPIFLVSAFFDPPRCVWTQAKPLEIGPEWIGPSRSIRTQTKMQGS